MDPQPVPPAAAAPPPPALAPAPGPAALASPTAAAAKGAAVAQNLLQGVPTAANGAAQPLELERVDRLAVIGRERDISELQQVLAAKDKEFNEAIERANDARIEMVGILLLLKQKAEGLKGDVVRCDEKIDQLLKPGLLKREGDLAQFRADFGALLPSHTALERAHGTVAPRVQELLHATQDVAGDLNDALLEMDSANQRIRYITLTTSIPLTVRKLMENSESILPLGLLSIKDYEKVTETQYGAWKSVFRGLKAGKKDLLEVVQGSEKSRIHTFFQVIKNILNSYGQNQQFAICHKDSEEKSPYAIWDVAEQKRVIEESSKTYNPLRARYLQLRNDTGNWWNGVLERISLYQVKLKLIQDMLASQTLCKALIGKASVLYTDAQVARHIFDGVDKRVSWETPLETFKAYQEEHLQRFKEEIHVGMVQLQANFKKYNDMYKQEMEKYADREKYAEELEAYATHEACKTDQVNARLIAFREGLKGEYNQCTIILTTLMAALEKKAWELGLDLDRHEYTVRYSCTGVPERNAFWLNAGYYYGRNNYLTARTLLAQISTPPAPPAAAPALEPAAENAV